MPQCAISPRGGPVSWGVFRMPSMSPPTSPQLQRWLLPPPASATSTTWLQQVQSPGKASRAQQQIPSLQEAPCGSPRGPRCLLTGAGKSLLQLRVFAEPNVLGPAPRPPPTYSACSGPGVPDAAPSIPRVAGQFHRRWARRRPQASLWRGSGPTDVYQGPLQPAAPNLPRRLCRPPRARGFKAELQRVPRPFLLHHPGGPREDKFQLRRPAPGQALPIWVDCPAGSPGGLL
ncbi:hypothetical protein NDU88_000341 [Pleurodeles waltl]|uniref:Uncharacterized protein n=1 Tax=Pleurodeles waltl TaxID=8319 RepID=A0AAV7TFJ3_PLEWA|nr:hypothetical protein NDU88_000341 [Pleurodeles waltl]